MIGRHGSHVVALGALPCVLIGALLAAACASREVVRRPAPPLQPAFTPPSLEGEWREHATVPEGYTPSLAFELVSVALEAAAQDGAGAPPRPTVVARQLALVATAMFDAWAAYDDVAVGTTFGAELRQPPALRTDANRRAAVAHALYTAALDQFPKQADLLERELRRLGFDPNEGGLDSGTAEGLGNLVGRAVAEARHHDGANQLGDEAGSSGEPYSDDTRYRPVNPLGRVFDPDRWQPVAREDGARGEVAAEFTTPHWYRVRPFGLVSAAMFRPAPPPSIGSAELRREVERCLELVGKRSEADHLAAFLADGARGAGPAGLWLRFAQDVSVRERHGLDEDVALFFAVANTAHDTLIAVWDSKRTYDTARPVGLARHYCAADTGAQSGLAGHPGLALLEARARALSAPASPGYVAEHSAVGAACAEMLRLLVDSDALGVVVSTPLLDGQPQVLEDLPGGVTLEFSYPFFFATLSGAAEAIGHALVTTGEQLEVDDRAGRALGLAVAAHLYPVVRGHFEGRAP